jgi:hypothetical protein
MEAPNSDVYTRQILYEIQTERTDRAAYWAEVRKWMFVAACVFVVALILNVLNTRLQFGYVWDFFAGMRQSCSELSPMRIACTIQYPWFAGFFWKPFVNPGTPYFMDVLIASKSLDAIPDILCHGVCTENVQRCRSYWLYEDKWNNASSTENPFKLFMSWHAPIAKDYREGLTTYGDILIDHGFYTLAERMNHTEIAKLYSYVFDVVIPPGNRGCEQNMADTAGDILSNAATGAFLGISMGGMTGNPWGAAAGLIIGGVMGGVGGYGLSKLKENECEKGR